MKPQFFTLANGLRIMLIDTKTFPTMTTLLLVGAGSRYEDTKNNGLAHFLEHMFFKGSRNYPDPYTISSTIEGMGGVWNAFTAKDYTGYWIKSANYHFDKVIDVIADMLLHPLLLKKEIEKEKGVIVEEINMYEDMPQNKVEEIFENLIFKGTPLGHDIIGSKETVTSFQRRDFLNYLQRLYHPKNALLVVAGGMEKGKDYGGIIGEKFSNWVVGKSATVSIIKKNQTAPALHVYEKKTEQVHFCLGFPTFSFFDARKYALSVLSTVLGGGASSKLFTEVREKRGLCYYIGTGRQHYHDVGNIVTQAGVPKDIGKVKEAIRATFEEHRKIVSGQISAEELQRAKEIIKGRFLLSMEDSFNVAHYYGRKMLLETSQQTPEEVTAEIGKVTRDQVVGLASDLFSPEKLNVSLVGPLSAKDITVDDLEL
ncbi:insulinase family protein [Candidatus Roizmanbacteria bacterium]|nr:insulinase family protein [Candidatus Roizmanbacteria bacterium]